MKQKEKEVLLKTFCSLLLYNGYFSHGNKIHKMKTIELDGKDTINNKYPVETCYPYLRPMSSMTEKQKVEYNIAADRDLDRMADKVGRKLQGDEKLDETLTPYYEHIDWLNAHHFDYRGLIEKGLALEAPKNMYNI